MRPAPLFSIIFALAIGASIVVEALPTLAATESAIAPRAARLVCETLPLTVKSACNEVCAKRDQACVAAVTSAINPARQEPLSCETRHDKDPSDVIICRCCAVR